MTTTAPDGAYIIGGGKYHYGQTITEDLARAAFEFPMPNFGNMIELLFTMLEQLPLDALRPFQGFLGLGDGEFQSVSQAVEAIVGSLKERHAEWIKDFETRTGLNVDEGVKKFLESLQERQRAERLDWVSQFEDKTSLNVDEGALKFLQSLRAAQIANRLDWISDFETKTGLNIDEGALKFLQSLRAAQIANKLDWLTDFETRTGLNVDEGVVKFLQSLRDVQIANRLDWISDFETKTGLNIDEGAVKFLQSLKAQQQANRLDWITEYEAKTGLEIDSGAAAFLASLLTKLKPEWVKDTNPISDRLRDLIDKWANAHDGGTGTNRPIQDAIDAWLENMRTATAAKESADRANLGVAAIRAEQAGGWSDEFAYSEAAKLDAAKYQEYRSGNANQSWGPDGKGVLTYRPNATVVGLDPGQIIYREKLRPIAGANGSVYVRLTKPPKALSQAAAFICWHMDVTGACNRFEVKYNKVQLQTVDAVGAVTNVGAAKTIPALVAGDALEVKWTGARVQFMRYTGGNIITDVDMAYTPSTGTFVGFGGFVPVYVGVGGAIHPAPDFGGITASPKGI